MLATATVGEGGWADLQEPILVRVGEAFVAVRASEPFMKVACNSFFDPRLGPCVPGSSSLKH